MDIIICIIIFAIGAVIGFIIGLILLQKLILDSLTKYDIEIAKLQVEIDALKEQTDGGD